MAHLFCFPHTRALGFVLLIALLSCANVTRGQANPTAIADAMAKTPRVVNASWWGFNEAESTQTLQAAIDSGADKVIVPDMGKPWIVDRMQLAGDQEILFEEGCVVQAKRGAYHGSGDSLFTATLKQNITLRGYGATFRMWKADYHTDAYTQAEWRHCLSIRSCTNINVYGLTLAESGGDGIYLGVSQRGVTNTNVHIKDVTCDGNNRQGISVISAVNLLIEDTVLKNTSGTAPKAGIDFEPNNASEKIVNCVMRNCISENNDGAAYALYLRPLDGSSSPISLRIENCISRGTNAVSASITTSNGGPNGPAQGQIDFVDCRFEETGTASIAVRDVPAKACRVRFEDCTIADAGAQPKPRSPISFSARDGCTLDVGGVEFADCTLVEPTDRPLMTFNDYTGEQTVRDVTGTLKVVRDGKVRIVPISKQLLDQLMPSRTLKRIPRYDLAGVHFIPAFPDAKLPHPKPRLVRQRKYGEYLIYAHEGDDVQLHVRHLQVGRYSGDNMKISVLDESAKRIATLMAPFQQETQCHFVAPTTGTFKLVCDAGANCVHVDSPTHRLCLVGINRPLSLISTTGDLYFWVPGDAKEFGVKIFAAGAERVSAAVLDPSGKQVWAHDNIDVPLMFDSKPRTSGKDEVWQVRLDRPSEGAFEDFYLDLRGIPCIFACTPESLLKPTPSSKK